MDSKELMEGKMVQPQPEVTEYDECPICHGRETWIKSLAVREIAAGRPIETIPNCLYDYKFVMRNTNTPPIIGMKATSGTMFIDVCKKCGILRATKVEVGEAVAMG